MKYTVEFKETSTTTQLIEATSWQEALMKSIKMHDHGEITFPDPPEADVTVIGHPYKITETWSVEDVEDVIQEYGYKFSKPLSDEEKRAVLLDVRKIANDSHGICRDLLDISIQRLYHSRIVSQN